MAKNEGSKNIVDDRGTGPLEGQQMLRNLWVEGFNSDLEFLALALGRDSGDLNALIEGDDSIDDELLTKIQDIARTRNIDIEQG